MVRKLIRPTKHHIPLGVVLALVVSALVVVAVPLGAAAQTVGDVEARDQLIANQENLLNTYRCLFGVDTQVVPGGCPNPDKVTPGVSPKNPTPQDIEVRDGLIQNQEALLNVYRCRFDVDTQIVPGGCIDGVPAVVEEPEPKQEPAPTAEPEPVAEPATAIAAPQAPTGRASPRFLLPEVPRRLRHPHRLFSGGARPGALQARDVLRDVLANRPDLLEALADTRTRVAIMAEDEVITDIPEFRWLYQLAPGRDWDVITHGGGVGPNTAVPVLVVAVQNLICLDSDLAPHADVLIHEIGHAVLTMAIEFKFKDSRFRRRVESAYANALAAGLWKHTYAATNPDEYWAEGTTAWFDLNSPPDPLRNNINTRAELIEYDPTLAGLLEEVYGDASAPSSCHETLDVHYNTVEGGGAGSRRQAGREALGVGRPGVRPQSHMERYPCRRLISGPGSQRLVHRQRVRRSLRRVHIGRLVRPRRFHHQCRRHHSCRGRRPKRPRPRDQTAR